jgi:stearoyl-CoA desaturase (delta-9 desaturase)
MLAGFLGLSFWGYVASALVLTHITIVAVTVYLHRCQAHRALTLHPAVSHFFRFWLWLTTGMVTREWVSVHRKHHAFCETEQDPHSPQVKGLSKVLWQGAELYKEEAADPQTLRQFGAGTPDDWLERNVYRRFSFAGIVLMLLIDVFLFGVAGLTIWAVQLIWIPFWAAGVVNGVGHFYGYRNYECADAATNIVPWGILIGGEELHNNHHAFPASARLSSRWWEFDIGWFYIRLMSMLGLAQVRQVSSFPRIDREKQWVDLDTLRAVLFHRLHVMARYARLVTMPVLRQELERADESCRSVLKRARAALVREPSLVGDKDRARLQSALSASEALSVVYDFRQRLQAVWNRTASEKEQMLAALQEWCSQAEASGIKALQDFARSLRGYSLKQTA